MEVAASAIAFAQAIGVIGLGIKKLRALQHASAEFMDLLNQLSRFSAQAELLRRALQSLADSHSDISHLDLDLIRSLQGDLTKVGEELTASAAGFISTSRGVDDQGRFRVRKFAWQREQARLMKLRDRARELSIEMSNCLIAINAAQGIRQTGMVLEVQRLMEVSFANLSSQLEHRKPFLLEGGFQPIQEASRSEDEDEDEDETPFDTWKDISSNNRDITALTEPRSQAWASDITVTSTLRTPCPPNCRCQCHFKTHVTSPSWISNALGMLMAEYRSIPLPGIGRCNVPLCKSASGSSFRLHYCFPRWLVASAIQISMSWGSPMDGGASIFLRVPRQNSHFLWINDYSRPSTSILQDLLTGELRPTDLWPTGETALTECLKSRCWSWLPLYLQHGFEPKHVDGIGMSAVHWARQFVRAGIVTELAPTTRKLLTRLAATKLSEDGTTAVSLIHQAIRGTTPLSLEECIQAEPQHINTVDELGFSPLHWAAQKADTNAVRTLLAAGANVNQQASHYRETPLLLTCRAIREATRKLVEMLLQAGALPDAASFDGRAPLHHVVQKFDSLGDEAYDLARMLLDHGANPRARNMHGEEPLHWLSSVVQNSSHSTIKDFVKFLLDRGADLESRDNWGATPLLRAYLYGNFPVARVLHELGANNLATDNDGDNCLHLLSMTTARQDPSLLSVDMLLGVDLDVPDSDGLSVFETLILRARDPENWGRMSSSWLVDMLAFFMEIREENWKAGFFLERQETIRSEEEDQQLRRWVARQQRKMEMDPSFGDLDASELLDLDDIDSSYCSSQADLCGEQDVLASEDEGDVFHDALDGEDSESDDEHGNGR